MIWRCIIKNKLSRRTIRSLIAILGAAILLYLAGVFYFDFHFYPGTTIDGVSVGDCTAGKASEFLTSDLNTYTLTIKGTETEDVIAASEIDYSYDFCRSSYVDEESFTDDMIKEYLSQQNQFLWPFQFLLTNNSKEFILDKSKR